MYKITNISLYQKTTTTCNKLFFRHWGNGISLLIYLWKKCVLKAGYKIPSAVFQSSFLPYTSVNWRLTNKGKSHFFRPIFASNQNFQGRLLDRIPHICALYIGKIRKELCAKQFWKANLELKYLICSRQWTLKPLSATCSCRINYCGTVMGRVLSLLFL